MKTFVQTIIGFAALLALTACSGSASVEVKKPGERSERVKRVPSGTLVGYTIETYRVEEICIRGLVYAFIDSSGASLTQLKDTEGKPYACESDRPAQ